MKRLFILLLLGVLAGCGDSVRARVEVASEKAVEKLDSILGSLDVKRKEIDLSMRSLKEAVSGISKARIKAQVKHDQIDRQAQPVRDRIAQADASLKKLRDYLTAGEPVEIGGKTYSVDDLKQMAGEIIDARKGYAAHVTAYEQSQAELKKVIAALERNQREYERHISRLESQIAQINAQMVAVKAMKDASATMGDGSAALAENVATLEDKVADLLADVQVELAVESQSWDAAVADKQIDAVDAFIAATQEPKDTIAEIDRILGEGK
jgi:phage shock protein A